MFRIEITAGSPLELADAIRALSPIAFPTDTAPAPLTIDADPEPAKPTEQVTATAEVKTSKPRAEKEDTTSNTETASAAPSVESVEKSDGVQLDIEEAIAEKSAEQAGEQTAAPEPKATAGDAASEKPFAMSREELKDWLIRSYLVECVPSQNDRPAAFKALCEENGFKNFTETPDDKLPALKALADAKIKQFKDGGK